MSAFETLMWRLEADPGLRSPITIVDVLDSNPDWDRLVEAHEWASRMVPRLRERVVEPALPVGPATWATDPHFDLGYHLRRIGLPEPGTRRQLFEVAQQLAMTPFDRARPPWEGVLVEGLEGGRAGYILKLHHSAMDGLGSIQLLSLLHSTTPEHNPDKPQRPAPEPETLTPTQLVVREVTGQVLGAPRTAATVGLGALRGLGRAVSQPGRALGSSVDLALSARRMLRPPPAHTSPLLADRSLSWRFHGLEVPFARLRAAAKAADGSVNDAYIAALLGAFRLYHEHFGQSLDLLPVAMPVSVRTSADPMGGNRFAGVRFAAPIGEQDPATRIRRVRKIIVEAREEPGLTAFPALTTPLSRLPTALLTRMTREYAGGHDLQASNVPGIAHPVYLAGARITRMFPFGPLATSAAMAGMMSHDGVCCIGVNVDSAAVTDGDVFDRCLRKGFDEVLALSPDPGPERPEGVT